MISKDLSMALSMLEYDTKRLTRLIANQNVSLERIRRSLEIYLKETQSLVDELKEQSWTS